MHLKVTVIMLVAIPDLCKQGICATGILVDLSVELHVQAKSNAPFSAPFPCTLYGVLQVINIPRSLWGLILESSSVVEGLVRFGLVMGLFASVSLIILIDQLVLIQSQLYLKEYQKVNQKVDEFHFMYMFSFLFIIGQYHLNRT